MKGRRGKRGTWSTKWQRTGCRAGTRSSHTLTVTLHRGPNLGCGRMPCGAATRQVLWNRQGPAMAFWRWRRRWTLESFEGDFWSLNGFSRMGRAPQWVWSTGNIRQVGFRWLESCRAGLWRGQNIDMRQNFQQFCCKYYSHRTAFNKPALCWSTCTPWDSRTWAHSRQGLKNKYINCVKNGWKQKYYTKIKFGIVFSSPQSHWLRKPCNMALPNSACGAAPWWVSPLLWLQQWDNHGADEENDWGQCKID